MTQTLLSKIAAFGLAATMSFGLLLSMGALADREHADAHSTVLAQAQAASAPRL